MSYNLHVTTLIFFLAPQRLLHINKTNYEIKTDTLDTSPVSNPNYLVQVDGIPDVQKAGLQPVTVHPDWLLAAWSVGYDGILYSNRSAATNLLRGLEAYFSQTSFNDQGDQFNYTSAASSPSATTGSPAVVPTGEDESATRSADASETQVSDFSTAAETAAASSSFASRQVNRRQEAATTQAPDTSASSAAASTSYTTATTTSALRPGGYEDTDYLDGYYTTSYDFSNDKATSDLENFIYFSFLQALSMVPFDKANMTAPNSKVKSDPAHPKLEYWAMVHVWAYGLDSRTSKFGVAVALTGCLCVIVSTILGLVVRRRQRSLTELIYAAIEHKHQGELAHANGDGELAARFRYKIVEDESDGRVYFRPI